MRPLVILLLLTLPAVAAPVPKSLKPKTPPASPDGAWYLVAINSDGVDGSVENMGRNWILGGENFLLGYKEMPDFAKHLAPNFTRRDPDRPNLRLWHKEPAVYEVDGDTLRVAYTQDGRKELTECKPGPGIHHYTFTRVKDGK